MSLIPCQATFNPTPFIHTYKPDGAGSDELTVDTVLARSVCTDAFQPLEWLLLHTVSFAVVQSWMTVCPVWHRLHCRHLCPAA